MTTQCQSQHSDHCHWLSKLCLLPFEFEAADKLGQLVTLYTRLCWGRGLLRLKRNPTHPFLYAWWCSCHHCRRHHQFQQQTRSISWWLCTVDFFKVSFAFTEVVFWWSSCLGCSCQHCLHHHFQTHLVSWWLCRVRQNCWGRGTLLRAPTLSENRFSLKDNSTKSSKDSRQSDDNGNTDENCDNWSRECEFSA